MPSNQLPEDVREQMIRVISQAGTLHGTGTTTHMEVSALPEVFADAVLDAIAPLIIEWARKDQAEALEVIAHIVSQANVNPVGDGDFIERYDMPVGSIHKAISFLTRFGIVVDRYGYIYRPKTSTPETTGGKTNG